MAEVILVPVAKQILGKLANLGWDQVALVWSLRNELEKLKGTVSTIQAVLRDAEEKQGHNHQITVWLEKLSDVMYDADDLLDDFSTETRRQKAAGADSTTASCCSVVCFLVSFPKRFLYEHGMARAIRAIREKLDDVKNDREFHLDELAEREQALPLETDPCPPNIVVGREADREEIVRLLVHSDCESNVSVVTIVGMGGLGKTTLAQLVFEHEAVKARFDLTVWVYVSQSFDVKALLVKMLQSMTGESQAGLQLAVLQEKLWDKIRDKRFLAVFDDVWEESARSWEDLAKYLMVGAAGSKVLVTTRSTKVAELGGEILKSETSSKVVMPYFLEGLSEDESWDLLVRKALHGEAQQCLDVERTGREILKKCCGVPLAVSTIAGVLSSRDPKSEWSLLLRDELSSISGEENHIMSTLRLSFNHLPSKLKHCFSYCKLFGKGDDLDVPRMVQLWMAQGYVESDDEGLGCLKTLVCRSFFQEVKVDELGNLWTCKMHDLMHDLASSIAGEKIEILEMSSILQSISSRTRHVVLFGFSNYDGDDDGDYGLLGDVSKVRTLMGYSSYSKRDRGRALHNFKRVRALRMLIKDSDSCEILRALGELKHLRFLALGWRGLERVPNTITKLLNLHVLDLRACRYIEELPRDVRKLVDLKHIYLHEYVEFAHMPKGIGELTSLQTLPIFVVGHKGDDETANGAAGLEELRELNSLGGELKIANLGHAEPVTVSGYVLKNKLRLQSLVLKWGYSDYDDATRPANDEEMLEMLRPHPDLKKLEIHAYQGVNLPNWLSTMTNLVDFKLINCVECEYLPPLHLCPSLKKLHISCCTKLLGIRDDYFYFSDDDAGNDDFPCFPALSSLKITFCDMLKRMPLFPTVDAQLELDECWAYPLLCTMMMKSSNLSSPPLSQLSSLLLVDLDDLEYLPEEGVCNLTSLQKLVIRRCPRLATLPPAMRRLTCLQILIIKGCPLLKERCREGEGEDWPNISHIPLVELSD